MATSLTDHNPPRTAGPRTVGRVNDWLVAPGADHGELAATYTAAVAGTVLAVGLGVSTGFPTVTCVVIAVVAFDGFGGAVANASPAFKQRFHGRGQGPTRHFAFVAAHAVQPAALALVVPGFGWTAAAVIYGSVLIGAATILATANTLRRPVAVAITVVASALALTTLAVPTPLAWFAPVLFVKLLLGHLLPEEAAR